MPQKTVKVHNEHTKMDESYSGVALGDLLGKVRGEPVWRLLGYTRSEKKTPYASQLFGDSNTRKQMAACAPAGNHDAFENGSGHK